jgi:hypothetical protein
MRDRLGGVGQDSEANTPKNTGSLNKHLTRILQPFALRLQCCREIAVSRQTYIADSPRHGALFAGGGRLVGLTLDAQVHDVVPADGTVIDYNVPGPEGDGVPLLDFEAGLLAVVGAGLGDLGLSCRCGSVGHGNVGHGQVCCELVGG